MFTGIITDLGRLRRLEQRGDRRLEIETGYDTASIAIGASIACSGVCLTVVETGDTWFAVEVSQESLALTTIEHWQPGTAINLERPLRLGDELGGHLVLGHVDGLAQVVDRRSEGDSLRFSLEAPRALSRFIAAKGSVALDGVSLTVNEVAGDRFGINIIPHTATATTFGSLKAGQQVNLEIDMMARYLQRLIERNE